MEDNWKWQKESLRSAENFGSGGRFIGDKSQKNLELLTMIKISLVKLRKSLVYHQNIFRKRRAISQKGLFAYALADVILQENPLRIWYMRHRERLYWNWQKKSPV